jgi:hypothetical protein
VTIEQERGPFASLEPPEGVVTSRVPHLRHASGGIVADRRGDLDRRDIESEPVELLSRDVLRSALVPDRAGDGHQALQESEGPIGAVIDGGVEHRRIDRFPHHRERPKVQSNMPFGGTPRQGGALRDRPTVGVRCADLALYALYRSPPNVDRSVRGRSQGSRTWSAPDTCRTGARVRPPSLTVGHVHR